MTGEEAIGATAAEPDEITPARGAEVALLTGAVVVGAAPLAVSPTACVVCPSAIPDTGVAGGLWDEVAGAVIVAMAGRLVNVRCCGADRGAGDTNTDGLCGSIGLVMWMDSTPDG